jgi:hypothetical protein
MICGARTRKYSQASLEAGDRLLKAVKAKLLKQTSRVRYTTLKRNGYSDALMSRLREL